MKSYRTAERTYATADRESADEIAARKIARAQHLIDRAGRKPIGSNGRRKDFATAAQLRDEAIALVGR